MRELRDQYIRPRGLALSVDEYKPTGAEGTKEERIQAALQPRYDNLSVWHFKGGACQALEDELKMRHPPHDDLKDALASAVGFVHPPARSVSRRREPGYFLESLWRGGCNGSSKNN